MKKTCRTCNLEVDAVVVEMPQTSTHYAKTICPVCNRFIDWLKKPENENKRTKTSKYSLLDYSKFLGLTEEIDFCEGCGRTKKELGIREVFHLHHKKWLEEGGKDELCNLMVLCTACHANNLWLRTYLHRHLDDFYSFYSEHGK